MAKQAKGKKSTAKKAAPPPGGGNAALVKELASLLPDIREDGLRWLINQAQVLLHNQQVQKVNLELEKLQSLERRQRGRAASSEAPARGGGVDIEENATGNSFIVVLSPARKFLDREEMRGLVKLCQAADSPEQAGPRLFRWLSENRRDILLDAGVSAKNDSRLVALSGLVRRRYTLASER